MNQHIKAALITAGILAISLVSAMVFNFLGSYITPEMIPRILTVGSIGLLIIVMYNLILSYLRTNDQIKDLVDRK